MDQFLCYLVVVIGHVVSVSLRGHMRGSRPSTCHPSTFPPKKSRNLGQTGDRVAESGGFDPCPFLNEQIGHLQLVTCEPGCGRRKSVGMLGTSLRVLSFGS